MLKPLLFLSALLLSTSAQAAVKTEYVEYTAADGAVMQGYLAYDDAVTKPAPGILIVPDWMGAAQPFPRDKAGKLASMGYVAFVADVYGKEIRPQDVTDAGKLATYYKTNRPILRQHIGAAYDTFTRMPAVDASHIVVIGYCFGGTTALELARSGVPLAGTVSFHGGLSSPTPADAKRIKGPVLVMHGADDPLVPPAEVQDFKAEMKDANVNMRFIAYPGAVHSFTNPGAGTDNSKGAAYNAAADQGSWAEFQKFLKEVL